MNPDYVHLTNKEDFLVLSDYAAEMKEQMQDLSNECTDMDFWRKVKDSKVPEKDRTFYNCVSLKKTESEMILEKIKTYEEFYEEMSTAVLHITGPELINCDFLRKKIVLLKKKMSEVYDLAKREVEETSSRAIYKMHRSFIRDYERLDCIVKEFENAALSDMLTSARDGWRRSLDEMAELKAQLKEICKNYSDVSDKYNDICEKYDALKSENKTVVETQKVMVAQNNELQQKMDLMMEVLKRLIP